MSQITALTIERDALRVLVSRNQTVTHWLTEPIEPGLVVDGVVTDPAKLGSILSQVFRKHHLPSKRVVVSVAGMRSVTRVISLPRVDRAILQEALHREAAREMPIPPEQLHLYWAPLGDQNGEDQYLVAGTERLAEDGVRSALKAAGVKDPIIEIRTIALARASGQRTAVLVHYEKDGPLIIILSRGAPWIVRTAAPVKNDIQTRDAAEQLATEVARTIQYFNGAYPNEPVDATIPVLLSGELSTDPEVARVLEASLKRVVAGVAPPLSYPNDLPATDYVINMGLALWPGYPRRFPSGMPQQTTFTPALAPVRYPAAPSQPGVAWLVASIVFIAASLYLFLVKESKEWQLVQLSAQSETAETRLDAGRKLNTQLNAARTGLKNLRDERQTILQQQGHFSRDLDLIMERAPWQIQLTDFVRSDTKLQVQGRAATFDQVLQFAKTLEDSPYFSSVALTSMSGEDGPGTREVSFTLDIVLRD